MGQTKYERSYEEGQRQPGDYEALVAQGPIAKRKLEHLGHTDTGVAMLRQLIIRSINDVKKGKKPPRLKCHEDGLIHTLSCDVIVSLPQKGSDEEDAKFRKSFGKNVANIVLETQQLTHEERKVEVERRVKELKAELKKRGEPVSGKKADLVSRYEKVKHVLSKPVVSDSDDNSDNEVSDVIDNSDGEEVNDEVIEVKEVSEDVDYLKMKVSDLRKMCVDKGIDTTKIVNGKTKKKVKLELVESLTTLDNFDSDSDEDFSDSDSDDEE